MTRRTRCPYAICWPAVRGADPVGRRARDGATRQVPGQHRLAGTEPEEPQGARGRGQRESRPVRARPYPGAANVSWHTDLVDTVSRDIAPPAQFQALLARAGIDADTTTILYGDNNNWFAAWGAWVFDIYGIQNVKLLDGGRKKWEAEGRPLANSATVHAPGNARVGRQPGAARAAAGRAGRGA